MTRSHLHRLKTTPQGKGCEKGNVGMQLEQTANVMRNALVISSISDDYSRLATFSYKEFMRERWHVSC